MGERPVARAVLLTLYSGQYPAIGESHGLSVVAGSLQATVMQSRLQMRVLDMVQWGEENPARPVRAIHEVQANVLAIGLPYGTFSVLQKQFRSSAPPCTERIL